MPGATAWLDDFRILVLSSGVWWSFLLDIRCLWRHNVMSYSRLQTNVLAKFVDITCIFRDAGAAVGQGEQWNSWGQWNLIKNKKIVTSYVCFCSSTSLTSKIITKIIENHRKFSGCPNICINLFQDDLGKPWNYPWYCYEKTTSPPLPPFWKGRGAMAPPCLLSPASLCILFYSHSLYSLL